MNSKIIGGILLIIGTSIGGGMLALPIANAAAGFWESTLFLIFCWLIMTAGAFYLLEANLYLPRGKNMISMAASTLGPVGKIITWLCYLALLEMLLSAYISGGSDVFGSIVAKWGVTLPAKLMPILFTMFFGLVVYSGIKSVDYFNRFLMFGKLGVYLLLVILITPYVDSSHFEIGDVSAITGVLMLFITSFGFAIIIPNLREYFDGDLHALRKVIIIGSLIPLICYIAWDAIIMGAIEREGSHGLLALLQSSHATSGLVSALENTINNPWITKLFSFFTSISMLTAFLGVSLALIDFLADGIGIKKQGIAGSGLFCLTFLPPLFLVLILPGIYISALKYAGYLCVILLIVLPTLMTMAGRKHFKANFTVPGGKALQITLLLIAALLMLIDLF